LIINKQLSDVNNFQKFNTMVPGQLIGLDRQNSEMFDNSVANPAEETGEDGNIFDEVQNKTVLENVDEE
jgi:hypothetical protein